MKISKPCVVLSILVASLLTYNHIQETKKPLYGKKIALIGDSITAKNWRAFTNWTEYLESWTGAKVQNLGKSGTNFHGSREHTGHYYKRIEYIDKDTDIIGVAISLNALDALPLGSDGDVIENNTISGYVDDFFRKLKDQFKNTRIVCYIQNSWEKQHKGIAQTDEYISTVKSICYKHNIEYYDSMYKNIELLNPCFEDVRKECFTSDNPIYFWKMFTIDNVHPNSKGHKIIAKELLPIFLK